MSDDYRDLYGRDDWYREIPEAERQSERDKYELLEDVDWIPWPEAPAWVRPFRLDNGHIRSVGAWRDDDHSLLRDYVYCVRALGRPHDDDGLTGELRGSVWDGASPPAFDAGAMLASLWHDIVFAAHRADLLGDVGWRQRVAAFIACNRRFGRMLRERTRWRRKRGLPTPGIERLGNARNVWTRIGLGAGGWRAWTRAETERP